MDFSALQKYNVQRMLFGSTVRLMVRWLVQCVLWDDTIA